MTDPATTPQLLLSLAAASAAHPAEARLPVVPVQRTGLDLAPLPWYEALALWKAAIFCEAIYTRWLRGERPDDTTFAPSLEAGVPRLLDQAARAAERLDAPVAALI